MLLRRIALVLVLVVVGGCSADPGEDRTLPAAGALVGASAEALRDLRSVSFELGLSGPVPGLPVREVAGEAARGGGASGFAHGEADVQERTERVQYDFRLADGTLSLTDDEGNHTETPAPEQFTPARVLDPEHGLRGLLLGATGLETENRERIGEIPTYRVAGQVPEQVVSRLIPGIRSDVTVKFWISERPSRDLVRVWMQIPPRQPNEGAVMLELALSRHNAPVDPTPAPTS
ncbi:lipoprotein LprG [Prauserella shujinwangii]|uniref:Lipoprotein LprG n=1 Tax=Prauserella shujinwangii TaxID=1453103 RepID=A0A2T0LM14_9PSEU|nr:LppX_LprAFG lipoprotein [Prauserella shujinwangii]PRX44128.1 lipoprotein LprG [Prauserella shujinwangii]